VLYDEIEAQNKFNKVIENEKKEQAGIMGTTGASQVASQQTIDAIYQNKTTEKLFS